MRSRDGSQNLLLRLSAVILLLLTPLFAQSGEYLISYRYVVKNATLYNSAFEIAHVMKKCQGKPLTPLTLEKEKNQTLKDIINPENQDFFNYIAQLGLEIRYTQETRNNQANSTTIITLKTTCFKVDFNDYFVTISALK